MSIGHLLSQPSEKPYPVIPGDFYVATNGNDENDGTLAHPFATLDRAARAAREKRGEGGVTVCVRAGEYDATGGFRLGPEDSGSAAHPTVFRAYGDGETVLNGGVRLPARDFSPADPEARARLSEDARDKVVCVDLKKYGLTRADWGPLCPIGAFGTEDKYDDYVPDKNCELFVNGKRMTLARYPNEGYLRLSDVADVGEVWEYPAQNYHYEWNAQRNHRGGAYIMDKETTARAKGWREPEKAWVYGFFCADWADSSTPVARLDTEHRTLFPRYVARYGARKDAIYYFYNILEELDAPGEWYLDRDTGVLYLYPPENFEAARVELTIARNSVIALEGVCHATIEGFTVRGCRGDAVTVNGDDNEIRNLRISCALGNAVVVKGYRNRVSGCDITGTGKGGIWLDGGDRARLTPGGNIAEDNYIHDWAQVYMVYNPAVRLDGVSNVCAHNEMCRAPHAAVFYYGNDHVVEYNYIHQVVLHSSDAGAIYSGQDWTRQGCVVRYNCLEDIGGGDFQPDGIYFDDMLSGQTAYGNLLINVKKNGFLIGGGRDIRVFNNILVNCGTAIKYDDRGRDGFTNNGWAKHSVIDYETGGMWARLREAPYRSPIWAARYPLLAKTSVDFSRPDDPDFPVNPAYSRVHDNVIIDENGKAALIYPEVQRFSEFARNIAYRSAGEAGMEDYRLLPAGRARADMPTFEELPLQEIGRR